MILLSWDRPEETRGNGWLSRMCAAWQTLESRDDKRSHVLHCGYTYLELRPRGKHANKSPFMGTNGLLLPGSFPRPQGPRSTSTLGIIPDICQSLTRRPLERLQYTGIICARDALGLSVTRSRNWSLKTCTRARAMARSCRRRILGRHMRSQRLLSGFPRNGSDKRLSPYGMLCNG